MWHTCSLSFRPIRVSDKQTSYQIFTFDTVPLLEGNVLVIVLSHLKGNYYLTASVVPNTHMKRTFFEQPL